MKEADGADGADASGHPNPVKDEPDGSLWRISLTSADLHSISRPARSFDCFLQRPTNVSLSPFN